ncbi:hypothetical protein [Chromobacterium haemolyticum]|uniref:hypothetical protein n=1 Tax=Chromobacterium haemolyticum TaxID=394935 RepID=UPI0012DF784D|nr:hypothetical protein [Chromobacterium haemolyticum]
MQQSHLKLKIKMKKTNPFEAFLFNGDWHTEIMRAISLSEAEVKSSNIKAIITELKQALEEIDECLHTVTVAAPLPIGFEPNYLLKLLAAEVDSEAVVALLHPSQIALTITHRGSHSYVEQLAKKWLRDGIAGTMYTIAHQNGDGLSKGLPSLTL